MTDKIDFEIPQEVIDDVTSKLNEVKTALEPYLIALTPTERRDIPKMGDSSVPFVEKVLDYSATNPEFANGYLDLDGLKNDMAVYNQLLPLFRIIEGLYTGLSDTTMEAGSESYVSSLNYYNSVKLASKMDIPGAKAIYDDLAKRFAYSKKSSSEVTVSNN